MSASGQYGETRVATGIVGSANPLLGDRVAPVLRAQIAASPQDLEDLVAASGVGPDPDGSAEVVEGSGTSSRS